MGLIVSLFSVLGEFIAKNTAGACFISWFDEEKMPESLL